MFDLRYHVASLAAVFVALVLGIFVGVGLSGRGFVSDAERENLQSRIEELRGERDDAVAQAQAAGVRGDALDKYARTSYPDLVRGRLDGSAVGVVFVGSVDQGVAETVRRAVDDAGGRVTTMRALRVPLDAEAIDDTLGADPETRDLAGPDNREQLGRELARELVNGGPDPVLDRVAADLVEEQSGVATRALDAVVVARPARPQGGETQTFLSGLYGGLAAARLPAVGVDQADDKVSAVPVFRRSGLATVSGLDDATGQVALVYLLAGSRSGSYGLGQGAVDGVLPAPPTATRRGVSEGLTVLVAARDEEARIGDTVATLRAAFPEAEVVVADDGSRDATAAVAEAAGARVVRLPRRGKGQALTLAERECRAGPILLCDADLRGDLTPLVQADADLAVASFARRDGRRAGACQGRRARARPPARRAGRPRAALRSARAHPGRARGGLPRGGGVRGRDADDDRRSAGGAAGDRGRARPGAPRDRPRRPRVRPPRPAAPRPPAGDARAAGPKLPRAPAAARRRRDRARGAGRRAGRGDRPRRRPLERAGARLPGASSRGGDDRHAQARRDPALGAVADAVGLGRRARRSLGERPQPARHPAGPRAQGVPRRLASSSAPGRAEGSSWPSCSRPTITGR